MEVLAALTLILLAVWLHGVLRERWYRTDLARRAQTSDVPPVPGLVSLVAARPRVRAELARATRLGSAVHVAIATSDDNLDHSLAQDVARAIPRDALGVVWDASTVLLVRSEPFAPTELPQLSSGSWSRLSPQSEGEIDAWLAREAA